MRKILSLILCAVMIFSVSASVVTVTGGTSSDPADSYEKITAPNEDTDIDMWFEHTTVKFHQEDTESTGRDTYSIYMAKNEIQGAQVILYSATAAKSNLTASITDMTAMDGSGSTLSTELFYEYYVEVTNINTRDVYGLKDGDESPIRDGMIPEAIAPLASISSGKGTFGLTAGKSQALLIKVKTELSSAHGWYSATFDLKDSSGNIIKTATVYTYVWNFEITEKGTYQTSFYIEGLMDATNSTYKEIYDYMLENRMLGMQLPGKLNSSNEYLSNPRVTAFRIANHGSYLGKMTNDEVASVYNDLSTRDDWEDVKSRAYFYTVDEPVSEEVNDYNIANGSWTERHGTMTNVLSEAERIKSVWEDPYIVLPLYHNAPYPYYTYSSDLAKNEDGTYAIKDDGRAEFVNIKDSIQAAMDNDAVTVWCPMMFAYTPLEMLDAAGYKGYNHSSNSREGTLRIRNLDDWISGFDVATPEGSYFDWSSKFGSYADRVNAYKEQKAREGTDIKTWWYACSFNGNYTYANHLIENTGLQTRLMYWQSMQVGATGYLYYGVNLWDEHRQGSSNYANGTGKANDGSIETGIWTTNKVVRASTGYSKHGDGILLYGSEMARKLRVKSVKVLGTVRMEMIRDGIEDYEMLNLYRELYSEDKMQALISKISNNVADYLSLPLFDRSGYSDSLTDDDIFAAVRIELGNAVEKGTGGCTEHSWDNGVITTEPTTTATGVKTFTCTVCGETKEEAVAKIKLGDVNGDGRVRANDALLVRRYLAGEELTGFNLKAADVSGDGRVTSRDVLTMSMYLAGKINLG